MARKVYVKTATFIREFCGALNMACSFKCPHLNVSHTHESRLLFYFPTRIKYIFFHLEMFQASKIRFINRLFAPRSSSTSLVVALGFLVRTAIRGALRRWEEKWLQWFHTFNKRGRTSIKKWHLFKLIFFLTDNAQFLWEEHQIFQEPLSLDIMKHWGAGSRSTKTFEA